MGIDIRKLQDDHKVWLDHNFPNQQPHQPLLGMGEEVGELMHAHLKGEQGIRGLDSMFDQMKKKADAIGDLFIYAMSYCNTNGLDLEKCIEYAWDEVKDRDWQKYPTNGVTA